MKKLFDYSIALAAEIVENGGEISRAEETVERICKKAGGKNINVFIIPSLITASAEFGEERVHAVRRIYKSELNLGKLEETNNLSRKTCGEKIQSSPIDYNYPKWFRLFCTVLATASFCIYFGGSIIDALLSGLTGVIIGAIPYRKTQFNIFSKTLIEAGIGATLAFLFYLCGIDCHPDKIMTGTIMLLIPGMSIGLSMRDMMSGNLIAGILRLIEALIVAFAIVIAYAGAMLMFKSGYHA